ncbi:hypothetical protein ACEF11_00955 [[Pasteurella] aerogenes]|nr:hypothetical protein [[Pasteurella] aerogenes]MDY4478530.1 hypothetical protein [[Pasteurella] aerogenes]VEG70360.1 Uncharacterised protein [[Pasteurella] aerogenes]
MIDIRNSEPTIINDELCELAHQYAALDFEKEKYCNKEAQPNSPLERIRLQHNQLSDKLKYHNAIVIKIDGQDSLDISYMLTYQEKQYKLDSEVIKVKIKLLG